MIPASAVTRSRAKELSVQDNVQFCDFSGRKIHGVSEGSREASAFGDGTDLGLERLFKDLDSGGSENLPKSSFISERCVDFNSFQGKN